MSLTEEDRDWIKSQLREVVLEVQHVKSQLGDVRLYVERVETSLLTEFHKWASPQEMRVRSHSSVLRAMDAEIEELRERIEKLEGRHPA